MNNTATKRRKVLAVLAGGVVLGVGAAITLAAWNDSEFATGLFGAGSFNLEGSTTSATDDFDDHATAGAAAELEFTLPLAENLAPTDVVYASFWVRLDAATTTAGTLTGAGATGTGVNADHLSYEVQVIGPTADCDATASGTVIASGDDLADFTAGAPTALAVGAGSDPGAAVHLCFAVTAEDGLLQGETAIGTWQFTAESN